MIKAHPRPLLFYWLLTIYIYNNVLHTTQMSKRVVNKNTGVTLTLTEDVQKGILAGILEGKEYKTIAEELGINYGNLLYWKQNVFPIEATKHELQYQLHQVEEFTNKLMRLDAGKKDSSLLAIQQKEAEFRRKYQVNAKGKYNDTPQIAIQVNLPSPIVDLGKLESE